MDKQGKDRDVPRIYQDLTPPRLVARHGNITNTLMEDVKLGEITLSRFVGL